MRLTLISSLILPVVASAKLATIGDLPYVVEQDASDITVQADGQSTLIRDVTIRINNDQGREAQSVQTLSFNSRAQKFRVLDAATLNGPAGKVVRSAVPKSDIEIKEVGDMSQSFDSIKQAGLSFPNVAVGSRIHMRYELKTTEVPIKGFYSSGFSVAGDNIETFKLRVHSKIPLHYSVHDAKNRFAHALTPAPNGWMDLDIHSTSPLFTTVTQEENPFTRPDQIASVSISTLPDWSRYGSDLIPTHEKILSADMPSLLKVIREKAASEKTSLDRIQSVAAQIAQNFRYFGDWRRRHGGYVPRSLNEIADSRYGDCKDLATVATALFRSLGYKSNVTWIFRGELAPSASAYDLPVDTAFNHAISRVEADGHVYWIDATDPVAFARSVFTDIADRPAFVLYSEGGKLERTPKMQASDATFESHIAYEFQEDGSLKANGALKLGGRQSIGLTARAFYSPVAAVNYEIIHSLSNNGKVLSSKVGDFDRGSRIVQDLTIPVQFTLSESGLTTSAGLGYPLFRDDSVSKILVDTSNRVSDLYIETPNTTRTTIDLLNVKLVGRASLDCDFHTDSIDLKREVTEIKNGVSITDTAIVKAPIINNETLLSPEFAKFQAGVRRCFNRAAVILEKR